MDEEDASSGYCEKLDIEKMARLPHPEVCLIIPDRGFICFRPVAEGSYRSERLRAASSPSCDVEAPQKPARCLDRPLELKYTSSSLNLHFDNSRHKY